MEIHSLYLPLKLADIYTALVDIWPIYTAVEKCKMFSRYTAIEESKCLAHFIRPSSKCKCLADNIRQSIV